jgi:tetratricopeptide (TPR) repeat protein
MKMRPTPPLEPETADFLSLLDIDPHERLSQLEKEVEGIPPAELLSKGLKALANNDSLMALVCLERAAKHEDTPELASNLGFCLAKEYNQFDRAIALCRSAIEREPKNTRHYLNLGRVYLMKGKKDVALVIYHEGLLHGKDPEIIKDLQLVGMRRRPVIPLLHREHILNRSLGYILARVKDRKK